MEVLCLHLLIFCVREHRFIQVEKWFCETVTLSPAQCCVNTDFSPDFSGFYPLGSCNSSRMESAQSLWAACSTVLFLYMVICFFSFAHQNLCIFPCTYFSLIDFFWKHGSPSTVTACLKHSLCFSISRYNGLHFISRRKPNILD